MASPLSNLVLRPYFIFLTPLLLSGSLIYPQAIMAMYYTFSNYTTAWGSADLQCLKFPLAVCFPYRPLETVYSANAVWTRTPWYTL